jgi:hypothetical protein
MVADLILKLLVGRPFFVFYSFSKPNEKAVFFYLFLQVFLSSFSLQHDFLG